MADPRLNDLAKGVVTANDKLADRAIRHALFLTRLKTQEVKEIVGFLNTEVIPDIEEQVLRRLRRVTQRGQDTSVQQIARLRRLQKVLRVLVSAGMIEVTKRATKSMKSIALMEAEFQVEVMRGAVRPLVIDFTLPAASTLESIITTKPLRGRLMSKWFSDLGRQTQANLEAAINVGIAEGEAIGTIVSRVRGTAAANFTDGVMQITRRNAETIVRTSVNHVAAQARERAYAANDDVVKAVQYVATLDARTTDICASLDGQVFPINEGPRPPQHMRCRSTTTPVLKSFRELGIDLDEAPPGTRASMDGQVPSTRTYGEWLKGQPQGVQIEALGKTRADLFRRGKIKKIGRFVDRKGRTLTLKQLRRREGLSVEDIKVPR